MTKRIKHVSELPEWFKLKKYEFANEIKFSGWYEQLYVRSIAFFELTENDIRNIEDLKNAFEAISENPNIDLCSDDRLSYFPLGGALANVIKPKDPHHLLGLDSITLKDYVQMEFFINKERFSYATNWYKNNNEKAPSYELPEWMNKPVHQSYTHTSNYTDTLEIWLALPDEYLIKVFKKYLAKARKDGLEPWTKYYPLSALKSWSELQMIPYIDLTIWSYLNNIKIPNRVMADALYPSGVKGEETIRKTVKPLIKKLFHPETLIQLSVQAALEISEEINN